MMDNAMTQFPKPSELMRKNRPYLFSDSTKTEAYELSQSELSHHLDTLTDRNQHKEFEVFCRKLSERELCPNLVPQTGPEGGGDGKVDTETYPVTSEISERWLVGNTDADQEKWAFAVSAQKKWSKKVRDDVKGIVETGRGYARIIFLSSRAIRARDRHRLQDELTSDHGIPVTILDREWILDRVFENNHLDLAFEYLNAGKYDPSKIKLGPNDMRRQQELDNLDAALRNPGGTHADQMQSVVDAYEAAGLSRELEKPRFETEGRFERAIRLAEKYGMKRQVLRAHYERAWTMFWWFDDVEIMNEQYEKIEELAFAANVSDDIAKLSNLQQVMVGRVSQGWEPADHLKLTERSERLKGKLKELSDNKAAPNNALYAESLLRLHELGEMTLGWRDEDLDGVWQSLIDIVKRAEGLGEFPAEMLDSVVVALSPFMPESEAFDTLIKRIADFMGSRQLEGKAGRLYLKRGEQKLDAEKRIDAIRWLGKASIFFMKEEYREEQVQTLYHLSVAYRGAGLLWAARAAALSALVQVCSVSDKHGELQLELMPINSLYAHISLELGRPTDFLEAVKQLHVLRQVLPINQEGQAHVDEKLVELDRLFACLMVAIDRDQLGLIDRLPDVLDGLQLFVSRMALMYRLGHTAKLREDESIPQETTPEELSGMMAMLKAQPATKSLSPRLNLPTSSGYELRTKVLGVDITFTCQPELEAVMACEAHAASLQSFVATALEDGAFPHADQLSVTLQMSEDAVEGAVQVDTGRMTILVVWPTRWTLKNATFAREISHHLLIFCAQVFGTIAVVDELETLLDGMVKGEMALERATLFSNAGLSHNRIFGSFVGQLEDWNYLVSDAYPLADDAPDIAPIELANAEGFDNDEFDPADGMRSQRHDDYSVNSVINIHLWNQAGWTGMLYASFGEGRPPMVALMFEDYQKGIEIFERWNRSFGSKDENDVIRLSILRGISQKNPFAYRGHVSRNVPRDDETRKDGQTYFQLSRMTTMEPANNDNLERFLTDYDQVGWYVLAPATVGSDGKPEFRLDLAIAKRRVFVRQAWQVGAHDEDMMAILPGDDVIVPSGVENPPFQEIAKLRSAMRKPNAA